MAELDEVDLQATVSTADRIASLADELDIEKAAISKVIEPVRVAATIVAKAGEGKLASALYLWIASR